MHTAETIADQTVGSQKTPDGSGSSEAPALPQQVAFHYTQTESFTALLLQLGASLLVSTYQANKLIAVRASGNGLSTLVRTFDRPMGLAVDSRRLTIAARREVLFLRNAPDIAPQIEPAGSHDACFLPRSSHVTGDMALGKCLLLSKPSAIRLTPPALDKHQRRRYFV